MSSPRASATAARGAVRGVVIGVALGVAAAFVATALAHSLAFRPLANDEAWSLVVVRRLLAGERLYRDVFAGATPLSFQLQQFVGSVWQNSVLSARALTHLVQLLTVAACVAGARRVGMRGGWTLALLALLLVFTIPEPGSLYSGLAVALAAVTLWCVLAASAPQERDDRQRAHFLIAGAIACGLSVATKQNVGALTTLAFGASLLLLRRRDGIRVPWSRLAVAGALAAALPMLPVLVSGSTAAFVQFTIANKAAYVRHASVPYLSFVNLTPMGEVATDGIVRGVYLWLLDAPYLFPFVVVALSLLLAARRRTLERPIAVALLFAAAALGGVFPRADPTHVVMASPALLLAMVLLLDRLVPSAHRAGALAAVLLLCPVWYRMTRDLPTAYGVAPAGRDTPSAVVPELAGLRLSGADMRALVTEREGLRAAAQRDTLFIVHLEAPRLYLVSGVHNPTAFDYPLVNPFGAHGQGRVLAAIGRGEIGRACVQPSPWYTLEPESLTQGIRRAMVRRGTAGPCELYVTPG